MRDEIKKTKLKHILSPGSIVYWVPTAHRILLVPSSPPSSPPCTTTTAAAVRLLGTSPASVLKASTSNHHRHPASSHFSCQPVGIGLSEQPSVVLVEYAVRAHLPLLAVTKISEHAK